jgi:hypothetical protein
MRARSTRDIASGEQFRVRTTVSLPYCTASAPAAVVRRLMLALGGLTLALGGLTAALGGVTLALGGLTLVLGSLAA